MTINLKPVISRFLHVNYDHIPHKEYLALEENKVPSLHASLEENTNGVMIYVPGTDWEPDEGVSGALKDIVAWAQKHECEYIVIGEDEPTYKELPLFDMGDHGDDLEESSKAEAGDG